MNNNAETSSGGGPFTNFNNVKNDGQFFVVSHFHILYETPSAPLFDGMSISWCSNVDIANITSLENTTISRGYTARCVLKRIVDQSALKDAGASLPDDHSSVQWGSTALYSSVYSEVENGFDTVFFGNTDNLVLRFVDGGSKVSPYIKWETTDIGEMTNSESFAAIGTIEWTSVEDASKLIGTNASLLSVDEFGGVYEEVWTRTHAEIAEDNQSLTDSAGGYRQVCSATSLLFHLAVVMILLKK